MSHRERMASSVVKLCVNQFVHIYDKNTNVTRLEVGPKNLVPEGNEDFVCKPCPFITIPPASFCTILHPLKEYEHRKKVELKFNELDIRFHQDPFPLYPGETLVGAESFLQTGSYQSAVKAVPIILPNHALALRARLDFVDASGQARLADEVWHEEGPKTYYPQPEVEIVKTVKPVFVGYNQALRLRAAMDLTDKAGKKRVTGEEWLIREEGAYVIQANEEVVSLVNAEVLSESVALHLRAEVTVKDHAGRKRRPGEEWLVTNKQCESLIPEIGIVIAKRVDKTVLGSGDYCIILNPVDSDGRNHLGKRILRVGEDSFFLQPGEELEGSLVMHAHLLTEDSALKMMAVQSFVDFYEGKKISRRPGDTWLIRGPARYIPPVEVEIICRSSAFALKENEGIYVQNTKTGEIRSIMGPSAYLLQAEEELYEKPLSPELTQILRNGGGVSLSSDPDIRKMAYFEQSVGQFTEKRLPHQVVTYRCPHNTAVQIYDYQNRKARIIFGPDLAVLGPHEDFTVLSLSAGKPKKAHAMKTICLMLGPDFITDIIEVETADHARLSIRLSFNNFFEYTRGDRESEEKIFSVNDFIGYACRQVGSSVRGRIAQVTFDSFHRNSASVIQEAVFRGQPRVKFDANNMVITSIDLQSVEPVDQHMRKSLLQSVQLAIEIATKSVERAAEQEASRRDQEARGALERQRLESEKVVEIERTKLLQMQAESACVESTGQAIAESKANADRLMIEGQSAIELATLRAEAQRIEHEAELERLRSAHEAEIAYMKAMADLELEKMSQDAIIEVEKFQDLVQALGKETIRAIAVSEQSAKVELLQSLGISTTLITDGNSPINLFNTAEGLIRR